MWPSYEYTHVLLPLTSICCLLDRSTVTTLWLKNISNGHSMRFAPTDPCIQSVLDTGINMWNFEAVLHAYQRPTGVSCFDNCVKKNQLEFTELAIFFHWKELKTVMTVYLKSALPSIQYWLYWAIYSSLNPMDGSYICVVHSFILLIISVSMICDPVIDNETLDKYAIGTLIIGNISPH